MKIGILKCGHMAEEIEATHGDYGQLYARMLGDADFEYVVFAVVDMEFPTSLAEADGWLITGSRHGAYEDLLWIAPLEKLIRQIRDAGQPLVGICFGHQIIAKALGGTVEKFVDGWAVGQHIYQLGEQKIVANAWHQDQVTQVPAGGNVLGSSTFCDNAVIAYGDKILTVQAHPEFGSAIVADLIKYRGVGVPDPLLKHAQSKLSADNDNAVLIEMLATTLKKGAS